jgi:hypothetical protein
VSNIDHWKKIRNCVVFIDNGAGVAETQAAMDEMLAEIARLGDHNERLISGIDLITDERNRLAKRVAALESYMRLIESRCDIPAKPGQVCHHNPAEIARQALGGGA